MVIAARGAETGERALASLEADGTSAAFVPTDVRDEASVAAAIDAARRRFAGAVLWLCSPGAAYVTGAAIAVDGGFLAA